MNGELGIYRIIGRIALTNTSEIMSARVGEPEEEVALKVLRPEHARSRVEREHLKNELRVGRSMSHPALIKVRELVLGAPRPYLVMERFPGPSLRERLGAERSWGSGGPQNVAEIVQHLALLADGLAYMHDRGWVHCDVKPQNILVGAENETRLIDMALAVRIKRRGFLRRLLSRRKRSTQGTRSYMSPEQIRGQPLDGHTDVYSLGITLFEVLTGRVPFVSDDLSRILVMHLTAPVPQIRWHRADVNPEMDELVQKMLVKRAEDRIGTMAYISAKLKNIVPLVAPAGSSSEGS